MRLFVSDDSGRWRPRHSYLILLYVTFNDTSKNTIGGALWESY